MSKEMDRREFVVTSALAAAGLASPRTLDGAPAVLIRRARPIVVAAANGFRSKDAEPIFELTRFLKPGANLIHFSAAKEPGPRTSLSPTDYFELVIGDGEMRQGQVMLNKVTSFRRTAAETGTFDAETTLNLTAR